MKKVLVFSIIIASCICVSAQDTVKTPQVVFHVMINGNQQGPYNMEQLQKMVQNGQLLRNTMVWQQGMTRWAEAEQIPELNPLFNTVPPSQPQQTPDTIKPAPEKKVNVKNAHYYNYRGKINLLSGSTLLVAFGSSWFNVHMTSGLVYSLRKSTVFNDILRGITAIGIVEIIIGTSQKIHAAILHKSEKKITLTPSETGIGITLNF